MIVLVVSRVHQYVPALAKARPLLILTSLVGGLCLRQSRGCSFARVCSAPGRHASSPDSACLAVLAVPFGISMGNSGKFVLEVYWKNLLLAFLIIATCRTRPRSLRLRLVVRHRRARSLTYFALFFFDLQRYGTDFSYARLAGLATWDANDVVLVLMPALACALLVYQVARPQGKLIALMALVGIGATVARSGSRGGLIGLVAVGVALLLLRARRLLRQARRDHRRRGRRA